SDGPTCWWRVDASVEGSVEPQMRQTAPTRTPVFLPLRSPSRIPCSLDAPLPGLHPLLPRRGVNLGVSDRGGCRGRAERPAHLRGNRASPMLTPAAIDPEGLAL